MMVSLVTYTRKGVTGSVEHLSTDSALKDGMYRLRKRLGQTRDPHHPQVNEERGLGGGVWLSSEGW